jgi:hypothetical protein
MSLLARCDACDEMIAANRDTEYGRGRHYCPTCAPQIWQAVEDAIRSIRARQVPRLPRLSDTSLTVTGFYDDGDMTKLAQRIAEHQRRQQALKRDTLP